MTSNHKSMNLIASLRQRKSALFIEIALLLGGGLTFFGLWPQRWQEVLPISTWEKIRSPFLFVLGCCLIIGVVIKFTKKRCSLVALLMTIIIALMAGNLGALLAVILYAAASLALGYLSIKLLHIENKALTSTHYTLIGAGIYASLVSLSAHLPVNYVGVYYASLLLPIVATPRWFTKRVRDLLKDFLAPSSLEIFRDGPKIVLVSLGLFHVAFAFFPELSNDGLVTHLFVPAHLALRHSWGFNPSLYVWSLMPMLGDWNYGIGYMMAGETAVRLINIGFIYLMMLLGRDLIVGAGGKEKGVVWGMLLFLATPLTFLESSSIFIESVWTCYLLAGLIWSLQVSSSSEQSRCHAVVLSGLMFGFAAAAKAITLIYLPVFFLVMLLGIRFFNTVSFWKAVGKGLFLFIIFGGIPYITAYVKTGNPVFPMYNEYFKSPFFEWSNFADTRFHSPLSWKLPYLVVFESSKYIEGTLGSAGFQWITLLLGVSLLAVVSKNKKFLILLIVEFLLIAIAFYFQGYLRYLFLSFLIFSVLLGIGVTASEKLPPLVRRSLFLIISLTILLNLLFFGASVWSYRDIPVLKVFSAQGREQMLLDRAPIRKMVKAVNALNKEDTPVIFLCFPHGAGLKADALYDNWYNPFFHKEMDAVATSPTFRDLCKKYGARYIIVDKDRNSSQRLALLEETTDIVSSYGRMSLRVLKEAPPEEFEKNY